MIKLFAFISWCISHNIGDLIFWPLVLIFAGFIIFLMGDAGA